LAAALALSGQPAEADAAVGRVLELDPTRTVSGLVSLVERGDRTAAYARAFDGLRRAGLPA
jgi:hypothetical protein